MRKCTSQRAGVAPMRTILRLVVPRTIESSTKTTLLPSSRWRIGFSFSFTRNRESPAKAQ